MFSIFFLHLHCVKCLLIKPQGLKDVLAWLTGLERTTLALAVTLASKHA